MHLGRYFLVATAGTMAMAIAACGATTGTTDTAIYAADAGTVLDALAAGNTLQSDTGTNTAIAGNHVAGDFVGAAVNPAFAIAQNDEGGIDVTIDGETMHFAAADQNWGNPGQLTNSGWAKDADAYDMHARNLMFGDYNMVWNFHTANAQNGALDRQGYAVIGTETAPGALEGKSLAVYSGDAVMGTALAEFSLVADFGSNAVIGTISNINNGNIAGTISMEAGTIEGNGFSGDLAAGNGFVVFADFSGTYDGKFFGPDAEEVGGVLSLYEGSELVEVGAFSGAGN